MGAGEGEGVAAGANISWGRSAEGAGASWSWLQVKVVMDCSADGHALRGSIATGRSWITPAQVTKRPLWFMEYIWAAIVQA